VYAAVLFYTKPHQKCFANVLQAKMLQNICNTLLQMF